MDPLATSFDVLLQRLGGDDAGAQRYERLRVRLVMFFRLRYPAAAEGLADQALDRLGRRLAEGTAVDSLESYALGIARLLVMEEGARQRKGRRAAIEALRDAELNGTDESSPAIAALRICLELQGAAAAAFILTYYATQDGVSRIEHRQRLAHDLGVTLNALRNRALRLRIALEQCVRQRLQHDVSDAETIGDGRADLDTTVMGDESPS